MGLLFNVFPLLLYFSEDKSMPGKLESKFQKELIAELKQRFEGCMVMKLDANYIQGIPDLLILWKNKWATLECKKSSTASRRPNQEYYISTMNKMSFSSFICPENKEEVLNDLCKAFKLGRKTFDTKSK